VPLEKNPGLAQALSTIELDAEIPEQLYVAVAEILAFLLRAAEAEPAGRAPET
jgi:flagellar biosynthesis protein